jgi:hypothetical protein
VYIFDRYLCQPCFRFNGRPARTLRCLFSFCFLRLSVCSNDSSFSDRKRKMVLTIYGQCPCQTKRDFGSVLQGKKTCESKEVKGTQRTRRRPNPKIFCCKLGLSLLNIQKFLFIMRSKEERIFSVDKIFNRILGWQGRLMSYRARLELLKACLTSIPIYRVSIIKFPK